MSQNKYIPNRIMNIAGTMPYLNIDPSISQDHSYFFVAMSPAKIGKNEFDYIVLTLKRLAEGYTVYPLGIISIVSHPLFISGMESGKYNVRKPSLWAGGARFDGHCMAFIHLTHQKWAGASLKRMRNLNNIGEELFRIFATHNSTVTYGGHEMLGWNRFQEGVYV